MWRYLAALIAAGGVGWLLWHEGYQSAVAAERATQAQEMAAVDRNYRQQLNSWVDAATAVGRERDAAEAELSEARRTVQAMRPDVCVLDQSGVRAINLAEGYR